MVTLIRVAIATSNLSQYHAFATRKRVHPDNNFLVARVFDSIAEAQTSAGM